MFPMSNRLIFVVMVALTGWSCSVSQSHVEPRLEVEKRPPSLEDDYPQSHDYAVVFVNPGPGKVPLVGIRMPGGYVGSGLVFNCSLQTWDVTTGGWRTIANTSRPEPGAREEQVHVAKDGRLEVCRYMLPGAVANKLGTSQRVRFRESWSQGIAREWLSAPFIVE